MDLSVLLWQIVVLLWQNHHQDLRQEEKPAEERDNFLIF